MTRWHLTRSLQYRDDRIAWDVLGDGGPVVFVHGFPGSSYAWRNIVPRLAARHKVYVFDLAGFGASGKRPGQELGARAQARLLGALLDEWGLEEPDIVAHDFGASVVLGSALFDRRRFGRIALIDAAALNPCLRENSRHGRKYYEAYATMPSKLYAHIMRLILPTTMHTPMDDETFDDYFRPWRDREGQAAYYRFLSQFDDGYLDDLEERLGSFDRPTSIVWGEDDAWIPLAQAHRLHRLLPDSEVVTVPHAGHFVMEDAPGQIAEILDDFFSDGGPAR